MQVIFLVHHARSHFLFHSQAKNSQLPYLFAAIRNAFQCNEVKDFNLTGKDLSSLAKMCLESQGRFSAASLAHAAGGEFSRAFISLHLQLSDPKTVCCCS